MNIFTHSVTLSGVTLTAMITYPGDNANTLIFHTLFFSFSVTLKVVGSVLSKSLCSI